MKNNNIQILLATYNGDEYIKEQLDSILIQTYQNFEILIRDDGSSDNTLEIIKEINDSRIKVLPSDKNLGIRQNFGELLKASSAEYIMFCDQDDIWLPNKIEITIDRMKQIEGYKKSPSLIFTDLEVVDKNLNTLSKSFWEYSKIYPKQRQINNILLINPVTGCTMMINKSLKEFVGEIQNSCIMHDWWITLVASFFGNVNFIDKATILYRQHGHNDIGAKKSSLMNLIKSYTKVSGLQKYTKLNYDRISQAKLFKEIYSKKLSNEQMAILENFIKLENTNIAYRMYLSIENDFLPTGTMKKVLHLISLLVLKVKS